MSFFHSSNNSIIEINFIPALIGSLIGLTSFLSITTNLSILIVLLRSKLLKSNPLYILASLNFFNDSFHGFGCLAFLAPTSFAQNYLFKTLEPFQPLWIFFMFVFQLSYYSSLLILIAIAINRLIAVVLPEKSHLIDHRSVRIIVIIIYPISTFLALFADFILPCCRTNYSFKTFSYQFFIWNDSTINYKNMLMDLPMNIITTLIILICYGAIVTKVIHSNHNNVIKMSTDTDLKKIRRKNELKCAIQFAIISTVFIATWVSFRIFPLIFSSNNPEWYSLTAFFMILNISSNAIIYITMNKEVKKQIKISVYKLIGLPTTSLSISTVQNNLNNNNGRERWANQRTTQI